MTNNLDSTDETKPLIGISRTTDHEKAKARWITVEPIILLAFVGIGTTTTVQSQYLQQRIADDVYNYTYPSNSNRSCGITNSSDPDYTIQEMIQHDTANWLLYFSVCSNLPLIFMVIAIGKWSDIKGRKVAMLVSLSGILVQGSVYVIVINHHLSLSLLYIGEVAAGLTGGNPLLVSVSLAYIADITTTKQRTFRIVIVETCIVFSIGVAQLAVGYLIAAKGFNAPFYLIISCQIAAILYTSLLLFESMKHKTGGLSFSSQMSKLYHGIVDLFTNNENNRRLRLLLICATFIAIQIFKQHHSIQTLFLIGQPFCWSSVLIGIFNACFRFLTSIGRYLQCFRFSHNNSWWNLFVKVFHLILFTQKTNQSINKWI